MRLFSCPPLLLLALLGLIAPAAAPALSSALANGATGTAPRPELRSDLGGGCAFDGPALQCVARADEPLPVIVARFAHPATAAAIAARGDDYSGHRTKRTRELLRQSLERNNERSIRLLEQASRDLKRGDLTDTEFATQRSLHLAAFRNYRRGIEFYQRAQWFDPTEPEDRGPDEVEDAPTG